MQTVGSASNLGGWDQEGSREHENLPALSSISHPHNSRLLCSVAVMLLLEAMGVNAAHTPSGYSLSYKKQMSVGGIKVKIFFPLTTAYRFS